MATINLGRIKPVNKGVWSNSTAYAVDDFVQYTDNGIVSTYIAVATSTNQAPSTSGTENSTYWKFMAKGVADSLSGLGNNKIVTTDGSGNATGLSIGTAGQVVKVNSGANGFEFANAGGGILQVKETIYQGLHGINHGSYDIFNSNFKVDITPTSADSKFLLEANVGLGMAHHDVGCGLAFMDSQVATSGDSNAIPVPNSDTGNFGSRTAISFGGISGFAGVGGTDDYFLAGVYFSTLYTPSAQNTNQRSFYPAFKRNAANYNIYLNYGQNNHNFSFASRSMIRVSEIANSIT